MSIATLRASIEANTPKIKSHPLQVNPCHNYEPILDVKAAAQSRATNIHTKIDPTEDWKRENDVVHGEDHLAEWHKKSNEESTGLLGGSCGPAKRVFVGPSASRSCWCRGASGHLNARVTKKEAFKSAVQLAAVYSRV